MSNDPLKPNAALLCKLGSIIVHFEEADSTDGHTFDEVAMRQLLADSDIRQWLAAMDAMAMIPNRRKP